MTRLNTIGVMALGLVAGLAITVAAQDVTTDYDKATDFSKYRSFSAQIATSWGNSFGEKRALEIIQNALVANTFYSGYGGYRYGGMGTSTTTVNEYTVGTMVVDIFDSKSKHLIWRGIGSDEASDKADKNQKKIAKATEKMFKKFPPKPGQ